MFPPETVEHWKPGKDVFAETVEDETAGGMAVGLEWSARGPPAWQ